MPSVFVITKQASVAEVQLGHGQSFLVGDVSVVEHVDAGQAGVTVARVLAGVFARLARLALRLQPARALARVWRRAAPVALNHVVATHPPAPAGHVQVRARCTHITQHDVITMYM